VEVVNRRSEHFEASPPEGQREVVGESGLARTIGPVDRDARAALAVVVRELGDE